MFFRKRKRMVDIRELQRRGVVRIPESNTIVPTNQDGFVELGAKTKTTSTTPMTPPTSNTEFFGFANTASSANAVPSPSTTTEFQTESDDYNKREVDAKITDLDNKIYKLENRIEVLERKLDINQPSDTSLGVMGW